LNRSTIFGIKIDFEKSIGSYLFDKVSNRKFLDFFGMFATLVLGYNHQIFTSRSFKEELLRVSNVKITNCEILADESTEFHQEFSNYVSNGNFEYFHYCCTGALAIEAAIKTAIDYKQTLAPKVISFNESFHGINGYGGFVTSRFNPVKKRLDGFPGAFWPQVENPVITYENGIPQDNSDKISMVLRNIEQIIKRETPNIVAILVEPIQCTAGDQYFAPEFFLNLRDLADEYDIPLIFDEIQTGFGGTGKIWYFDYLEIEPDILTFGKKTQLSGIMVKKKYSNIFSTPIRLEVTWDADLIDMIRCKYIVRTYQKENILNNVNIMGKVLLDELKSLEHLRNIRGTGLLIAFDFDSNEERDQFCKGLYNGGLICNPTREKTIRFRPPLNITLDEVHHAIEIIKKVDSSL
jgi:L-lysine 6-transaminase